MMLQEDVIVQIPENRVKFFGTTGRMLLPSKTAVSAILAQVPPQTVMTTTELRQALSQQFQVEAVCPVTTKKALLAIAKQDEQIPYWRILNQNGGLIAQYPGGAAHQAVLLQKEGLEIESKGKTLMVKNFQANTFFPALSA